MDISIWLLFQYAPVGQPDTFHPSYQIRFDFQGMAQTTVRHIGAILWIGLGAVDQCSGKDRIIHIAARNNCDHRRSLNFFEGGTALPPVQLRRQARPPA